MKLITSIQTKIEIEVSFYQTGVLSKRSWNNSSKSLPWKATVDAFVIFTRIHFTYDFTTLWPKKTNFVCRHQVSAIHRQCLMQAVVLLLGKMLLINFEDKLTVILCSVRGLHWQIPYIHNSNDKIRNNSCICLNKKFMFQFHHLGMERTLPNTTALNPADLLQQTPYSFKRL